MPAEYRPSRYSPQSTATSGWLIGCPLSSASRFRSATYVVWSAGTVKLTLNGQALPLMGR